MTYKGGVVIVPDTNSFLHFTRPDLQDWKSIVGTSNVTIAIAGIVIRELDAHKNSMRDRVLHQRARNIATWMRELRGGHGGPGNTPVVFIMKEPKTYPVGLDQTVPDNRFLATVLEYVNDAEGADVRVFTDDTYMMFTAENVGLPVVQPPEGSRLAPEQDAQAIELQRLKRELEKERSRSPQLQVTWGSGDQESTLTIPSLDFSDLPTSADVEAEVPLHPDPVTMDPQEYLLATRRFGVVALSVSAIQAHNKRIAEYREAMGRWVESEKQLRSRRSRIFQLRPCLTNKGSSEATGVTLRLFLDDPFSLLTQIHEAGAHQPRPLRPASDPRQAYQRPLRVGQPVDDLDRLVPGKSSWDPLEEGWPNVSGNRLELEFTRSAILHFSAYLFRPFTILLNEGVTSGTIQVRAEVLCRELREPSKAVLRLQVNGTD